jgi:signal transduction histidine kinase
VALARAALSSLAAPPGLSVVGDAPEAAVPVHTDPSQVVRILRGLLSNAFKFTAAGTVTLRVRSLPRADDGASGRVVWEVTDTGIGIQPEHLEAIFDEFRQVDGSVTRRFGGTGMGLAIARQLARRLGGDIAVRSTPGLGSSFILTLPAGRVVA